MDGKGRGGGGVPGVPRPGSDSKRRHESGRLGLYIVALSERRAGGGEAGVRGEKKEKEKWLGPGGGGKKTACSDRRCISMGQVRERAASG